MSEPNAVKVAKKRVRKAPHRWTSVEIVEAVIERMQLAAFNATGRHLGRGNAVLRFLGLSERRGIVNSEMIDPMEMAQLKAHLFDDFIRIYGADLGTALGLRATQKAGGRKGVAARQTKAEINQSQILLMVSDLIAAEKPERSIAGIVAKKFGVTPRQVRNVRNKRK